MQKLFFTGFLALCLSACGGNTQTATETSDADPQVETQDQPLAAPQDITESDVKGLYTAGGHDQSWAVYVDGGDDFWYASRVELDAMLPPLKEIFSYPEDIKFEDFEQFKLDPEQKTFSSDWGAGRFEKTGNKIRMVFAEKEGIHNPATEQTAKELVLSKYIPSFTPADLVGLFSGGTWHSQGYVVIIEERDGQLMVKGSETDGGEPDMEYINEYPEYFKFTTFTTFELNEDGTAFNSDWGKGQIKSGPYGISLRFEKLIGSYDPGEDKNDVAVSLTKVVEEEEE